MSSPNAIYWSTIYNYFASSAPAYTAYPQNPLSSPESSIDSTPDPANAFSPSSQSPVTSPPQEAEPALYSPGKEGGDEGECDCGFDFCDGFCKGLPDETGAAEDLAATPDTVGAGILRPEHLQAVDTNTVPPKDRTVAPSIVRAGIIESNNGQPDDTRTTQLDGTQPDCLQPPSTPYPQPDGTQVEVEVTQLQDPQLEEFVSYCYLFWQRDREEQAALDAWVGFYLNAPDPQGSVDSIPCQSGWERRVWGAVTRKLREKRG